MAHTFTELNKHKKDDRCQGCPLYHIGASFARTDGTGRNGVALIGEALGATEAIKGLPFQGDAGFTLNKALKRGSLERNDFLVMNTVNCQPPNNWLEGAPWEAQAIAHCDPYFVETLQKNSHVKALVPMGGIALFKLLGLHGVKNAHGTVHWDDRFQRWVIPTLHPSFVLRTGQKELITLLFDIQKAVRIAREGFSRSPVSYVLRPSPEEFERWITEYEQALANDPSIVLAADIETNYSSAIDEEEIEKDTSYEIVRISFSYRSNTAITLPFVSGFIPLVMRLLGGVGTKTFWNGDRFDVPRLRQAGVRIDGVIIDGMDAWHVLRPDLPKGLGYVAPFFTDLLPWKHLNHVEPEYYSCVDSDALIRIVARLQDAHKREGITETFRRYWIELSPRLRAIEAVGIGIDETVRKEREAHYESIRDNVVANLQPLVPEECKPWVKKGGYKGKPKIVREYIREHNCTDEEAWRALGYQPVMEPIERDSKAGSGGGFGEASGEDSTDVSATSVTWEKRWNKRTEFNPNSPQQILAYIDATHGAAAVPRHKKTGARTTDSEELERLARRTQDPVLQMIVDAANADGKISSFIRPWAPGPDGRVHTTFTNNPATPRLASQGPNVQNFPRRDDEAKVMRRMIVPGDGYEFLWEADYKSIEAILVGWYAKDPAYMRLAYFGIHDFMAGRKLGLDLNAAWDDAQLKAALKEAKKLGNSTHVPNTTMCVRDACKVSVHGGNYLEGPLLLHNTYPELFPTTKIAAEYQDFYFAEVAQGVRAWQNETVDFAHRNGYVENAWKLKRWFFNVKQWTFSKRLGRWIETLADDAKKAIATNPQGSAGLIMRGAIVSDPALELIEHGALMITIHDSLVGRARDRKDLEWCLERVKKAMEYPIKEMDNIVIPVEMKVGRNWSEMEEIAL